MKHILEPGGERTACDVPVGLLGKEPYAKQTAGHDLAHVQCPRCRERLLRRPQLLAAIIEELRTDGVLVPDVRQLELKPRTLSEAQLHALRTRKVRRRKALEESAWTFGGSSLPNHKAPELDARQPSLELGKPAPPPSDHQCEHLRLPRGALVVAAAIVEGLKRTASRTPFEPLPDTPEAERAASEEPQAHAIRHRLEEARKADEARHRAALEATHRRLGGKDARSD